MAITADVRHCDIFFALCREFQRIGQRFVRGKRADLFAWAVRVLEMRRKEQIHFLKECGRSEDSLSEDMLGFPLTWKLFSERAQRHYSARSFEDIIEKVIEAGVATRYYVECHRSRLAGSDDFVLVGDEHGRPVLYATLEEAQEKRIDGGEIIGYFFFHVDIVNKLIEEIYGLKPSPPQPPTPTGSDTNKKGGAQRTPSDNGAERTPYDAPQEGFSFRAIVSPEMIAQGSQFCEPLSTVSVQSTKGSQDCKPSEAAQDHTAQFCEGKARSFTPKGSQSCEGKARKTASNKNSNKNQKEITEESILISAPRAIDPLVLFQFDFSQPPTPEAILSLSRILYAPLPARYRTEEDKEKAYTRIDAAAQALASMPLVQEMGLRQLAATMAYQADEASPCSWRTYCRKNNPGLIPRLWNLESEIVLYKVHQEMQQSGWWPDYLARPPLHAEMPPEIDCAELAGFSASERVGMDADTAQIVLDWLTDLLAPHSYEVQAKAIGPRGIRGYAIEVFYPHEGGDKRVVRFYHFAQWEWIVQAEEAAIQAGEQYPLGCLTFVRHLADACLAYALDDSDFDPTVDYLLEDNENYA